jgi:hypothetical protein
LKKKKIKKSQCKSKISTIALILVLTISAILVALPIAKGYNADTQAAIDEGMYWDLKYPDGSDRDASYTRLLKISFVTIRHWKGTMEYHRTKDILHVKQLLGHKQIQNTMFYINL